MTAVVTCLALLAAGVLSAQDREDARPLPGKVEQMPSGPKGPVSAQPQGGFSSSIDGKWNCKEFGTMILKQSGQRVTGTYGKKGKISGIVKKNRFTGTWSEGAGAHKGFFDFETSIERMTTRPTNLRGKWKNVRERKWQATPWECSN